MAASSDTGDIILWIAVALGALLFLPRLLAGSTSISPQQSALNTVQSNFINAGGSALTNGLFGSGGLFSSGNGSYSNAPNATGTGFVSGSNVTQTIDSATGVDISNQAYATYGTPDGN
jgi:hypothetical protein